MAIAGRGTSCNKPLRSDRRVIVVLQGGLGNQLFQWCAGETICARTGYSVLYDCERGFRKDRYGRQFELANMIPPARQAREHSGDGAWRSPLERIEAAVEKNLMWKMGISSLPLPAVLKIVRWWPASEVVCRSHFQSLEYLSAETVGQIRDAMGLEPVNLSSEVAVHFRLARDQDASGGAAREHSKTVLPLEYYRKCLRQVRAHGGAVSYRVFSDRGTIPEDVFERGDDVVLDHPQDSESSWDTLARMAACRHFIIGNSTFSWWAAFLSRSKDKRIYAPKNWLFTAGAHPQRGIFPEEWRRIPA